MGHGHCVVARWVGFPLGFCEWLCSFLRSARRYARRCSELGTDWRAPEHGRTSLDVPNRCTLNAGTCYTHPLPLQQQHNAFPRFDGSWTRRRRRRTSSTMSPHNVVEEEEDDDEEECVMEEEEAVGQPRKKVRLMSGLTEAERRHIRQSQRALQQRLRDDDAVELEEVRQRNNRVFQSSVRYTREGVFLLCVWGRKRNGTWTHALLFYCS